eukprot:TRINITY_DN12085_c2_g1_i2.p1 TRINITY_DN12085_c2_g1~~TRINITY_DN12085_c2_g1_i2.p1  ORF type:complete len:324 (+),score=51.95 TRINITY_DN12085_c2_g1_i2:124-1095(+)
MTLERQQRHAAGLKSRLEAKNQERSARLVAAAEGNPSGQSVVDRPSTRGIRLPEIANWSQNRSQELNNKTLLRKKKKELDGTLKIRQEVDQGTYVPSGSNENLRQSLHEALKIREQILRRQLDELRAAGMEDVTMAAAQATLDNIEAPLKTIRQASWKAQSELLQRRLESKMSARPVLPPVKAANGQDQPDSSSPSENVQDTPPHTHSTAALGTSFACTTGFEAGRQLQQLLVSLPGMINSLPSQGKPNKRIAGIRGSITSSLDSGLVGPREGADSSRETVVLSTQHVRTLFNSSTNAVDHPLPSRLPDTDKPSTPLMGPVDG